MSRDIHQGRESPPSYYEPEEDQSFDDGDRGYEPDHPFDGNQNSNYPFVTGFGGYTTENLQRNEQMYWNMATEESSNGITGRVNFDESRNPSYGYFQGLIPFEKTISKEGHGSMMEDQEDLHESSTRGAPRDNRDLDNASDKSLERRSLQRPFLMTNPYKHKEVQQHEISRCRVFSDQPSPGLHPTSAPEAVSDKRPVIKGSLASLAETKMRKNGAVKAQKRKNARYSKRKSIPSLIGSEVRNQDTKTRAKMLKVVNFWHRKPNQKVAVPNVFLFHSYQQAEGKTEVYEEKDHSSKHVQLKAHAANARGGNIRGKHSKTHQNLSNRSKNIQSQENTPLLRPKQRPKLGSLVLGSSEKDREERSR